jgi:hypothetical protein
MRRGLGVLATLLIAALALLLWLIPVDPTWIEQTYATRWYLAWQRIVTPVGNVVPVALFDVLLIVVTLGLLIRAFRRVRRAPRGRRLRAIGGVVLDLAVAASVLAIWFSLAWGANYRRVPLRERLDYDRARVTPEAALEMARTVVREMNRLHPLAHGRPWPETVALVPALGGAFADAQRALGQPSAAAPGRPKSTMLQPYFRWAAIDGMTDPFFLETLVNRDALAIERPFVVAHEWSHLAGFAHEAEANFLGWAICLRADTQAQYSGWLSLYWHLVGSLPSADRRAIDATLDDGPRRDLRAVVERYQRSKPQVRAVAWQVYDTYLKANRVSEGIASYDAVVTLILGTKFTADWVPLTKSGDASSR